jgi:hypothetical protein
MDAMESKIIKRKNEKVAPNLHTCLTQKAGLACIIDQVE